ncbi:MAG TPA: galactosyltransferase-related protein [Bacillota bacterium]|nr:galactosyltransferase-related protein [Bacillota bacterium]
MKISVIIPFKSDSGGYHDLNLSYVLKRYQTLLPEVEVIVGHTDEEGLFNKAKAVNRAAKLATGDLLIIADADVFFGTKLIDKIKAIADQHPWIVPFDRCYRLTQAISRDVTKTGEILLPKQIHLNEVETIMSFVGALINVVPRGAFEKAGGMDERFLGWGEEDGSFAKALDTLVGKHYRMKEAIFHLWHPWADFNHPHRRENTDLSIRYLKAEGNPAAMQALVDEWR